MAGALQMCRSTPARPCLHHASPHTLAALPTSREQPEGECKHSHTCGGDTACQEGGRQAVVEEVDVEGTHTIEGARASTHPREAIWTPVANACSGVQEIPSPEGVVLLLTSISIRKVYVCSSGIGRVCQGLGGYATGGEAHVGRHWAPPCFQPAE